MDLEKNAARLRRFHCYRKSQRFFEWFLVLSGVFLQFFFRTLSFSSCNLRTFISGAHQICIGAFLFPSSVLLCFRFKIGFSREPVSQNDFQSLVSILSVWSSSAFLYSDVAHLTLSICDFVFARFSVECSENKHLCFNNIKH